MATTIAGVTVADPVAGYEGVEVQDVDLAALLELADGSAVIDHVASRERYTVKWAGLSAAQLTTLEGTLTKGTNLELQLPHQAAHVHVFIVPNTYRKSYIKDGSAALRWQAQIQFVEVS